MSKNNGKKKKGKVLKIIVAVIAVIIIAAGVIWFAIPKEMRNMVMMMAMPGGNYENHQVYQVIDRNDEFAPTAFEPAAAEVSEGDENVNVAVVTQMVLNENSGMLKKGNVQTVGVDDYTGWYAIADEGATNDGYPFGPSPLSYYTSGLAANLHTQIIKASEVVGVELDSVTVEVMNEFRWNEMLTEEGTGHLDTSHVNIIIESDEPEEVIQEIKEIALNSWAAGEALINETVIEPTLVVNGDNWENYTAVPGTTDTEDSFVDDMKLTSVTDVPRMPEYIELSATDEGMSLSVDAMSNMQFEIFAIAETEENAERPYLTKITLSTPSEETWEIYADEFMGENDNPVAPTSLEYFTMGTALCLTSQTTLVSSMIDLDCTEYRIENQTDYRQEDVNTADMASYADTVHSYVIVESDESEERLQEFYNRSLSLCFAGEGLKNATDMDINTYLNGDVIN